MDRFNNEHYADPTPQQALSIIKTEKEAMKTYLSLIHI